MSKILAPAPDMRPGDPYPAKGAECRMARPMVLLDDHAGSGRRLVRECSVQEGRGIGIPAPGNRILVIEGMHCAACALTIEEALCRVPGSSARPSVRATSAPAWSGNRTTRPSVWMQALRRAGVPCLACAGRAGARLTPARHHPVLVALAGGGVFLHDAKVMMYAWPTCFGFRAICPWRWSACCAERLLRSSVCRWSWFACGYVLFKHPARYRFEAAHQHGSSGEHWGCSSPLS